MKDIDDFEAAYRNGYEAGNAELVEKTEQLEEAVGRMAIELAAVKKERDAAVGDLRNEANCYGDLCYFCTKNGKGLCEKCRWEWRGIDG